MQVLTNVEYARARLYWLVSLSCIISLTFFACENPGSVGSSFTDITSDVVIDTLEVGEIDTDSVESFSGMLNFISAGQFDDPLFGSMTATGLIRPSLPSASSSDNIASDAEMNLRLIINRDGVYGDSLETARFDLVEINQIWRAKAWKLGNQVQLFEGDPVASFEVGQQDSVDIPLSSEWVDRYRSYYNSDDSERDSLYIYQFHGLAVVPRNESKIVSFNPSESKFIVNNPEDDTLNIGAYQWAYSLQRSGASPAPEGSEKVHSTLERLVTFDMDLSEESLGTVNIARVDLVFYQNNEVLNETIEQVSPSAVRPRPVTARLHLINPEHVSSALDPGSPIAVGEYREETEAYHFNITPFVNSVLIDGVEEGKRFYVRPQVNNGTIRSSLLFNHQAPPEKQPKLIVTSTKSEGSSN